jgi:hypothetical protein
MVREIYAYSFTSPLSIAQMFERLNANGPWKWLERDNDRYGEYISTRPIDAPHQGIAKILFDEEIGRFALNVELGSEAPGPQAAFDRVRDVVLAQVLPYVQASDITDVEDYSS